MVRLQCALTMLYFGDFDDAVPVWKALLRGSDDGIRKEAFEGFGWYAPEAAVRDELHALWPALPPEVRRPIFWALGRSERYTDLTEALLELLPQVTDAELRDWSDAVLTQSLDSLLHPDGTEAERTKAALQLTLRLKKELARAKSGRDRSTLQAMLLAYDPAQSVEDCLKLLEDPEPVPRRAALVTLLRAGEKLGAERLGRLAKDASPRVRLLALVGALPSSLRGQFSELSQDWYGGAGLSYSRRSRSSYYGNDAGVLRPAVELPEDLLNARLADEDSEVRLAAAAVMALEGSEDGVAYLQKVVRTDTRRDHGRLFVTILTAAWHDDYIPLLEEYGKSLSKGDYDASNLVSSLSRQKSPRARALAQKLQAHYNKE
jgi:hypothetical protein